MRSDEERTEKKARKGLEQGSKRAKMNLRRNEHPDRKYGPSFVRKSNKSTATGRKSKSKLQRPKGKAQPP
jgi:hypothetical protein